MMNLRQWFLSDGVTGFGISVCLAGAIAVWTRTALNEKEPRSAWMLAVLSQRQRALDEHFRFLRLRANPSLWVQLSLAYVLAMVLAALVWRAQALGALLLLAIPEAYLGWMRRARVRRLEEQAHSWLGSLARALQAAPSLGEALQASRTASHSPMSEEVDLVLREVSLGRPLDRALTAWTERVQSRTLTMTVSALLVGRETGGDLPEVLRKTADSLRELARLEGVLRTKTAEGRAQAWVISVLPAPIFFAVRWVDPEFFVPLEETPVGHVIVVVAGVLWVLAVFLANRILAVKI